MPRLVFELDVRTPRERMEVHLQLLEARFVLGSEVAGVGMADGHVVGPHGRRILVEIPVAPVVLDVAQQLMPDDELLLQLRLSGLAFIKDDNSEHPQYMGEPAVGEWSAQSFGTHQHMTLDFRVSRSDWFRRVREPLGLMRYLHVEIGIPRGTGHPLAKVGELLANADRALAQGDEPGVFLHCRGAVDALPGSPKNIFDGLVDEREAKALDDLLRTAGAYLHRGRHVDREGDRQGEFPITGADARFALNLTKVVVSHVADVLDR
ncbi:MAG TPA: hypothetical protein VK501_22340 [Baekduia sp.]|nr:hypothetical protein [Baekduia sp.]